MRHNVLVKVNWWLMGAVVVIGLGVLSGCGEGGGDDDDDDRPEVSRERDDDD